MYKMKRGCLYMKLVDNVKSFLNKDVFGGLYKRWQIVAMDAFAITVVLLLYFFFGVAFWAAIACMTGYVLKRAFMEYLIKHFESDTELQQIFKEVHDMMHGNKESEPIDVTPEPIGFTVGGFSLKGLSGFDNRLYNSLKWSDLGVMVALGVLYGITGPTMIFAALLGLFIAYKHWDVALMKTNTEGHYFVNPDYGTLTITLLALCSILWSAPLAVYTVGWTIYMISLLAQTLHTNQIVAVPSM